MSRILDVDQINGFLHGLSLEITFIYPMLIFSKIAFGILNHEKIAFYN